MSKDQKRPKCPIGGECLSNSWCMPVMCLSLGHPPDAHSLNCHLDISDSCIHGSGPDFSKPYSHISTWMSQRHLRLNIATPELMSHAPFPSLQHVPLPASPASPSPVVRVRVPGILSDTPLSLTPMSNPLSPQSVLNLPSFSQFCCYPLGLNCLLLSPGLWLRFPASPPACKLGSSAVCPRLLTISLLLPLTPRTLQ